MCRQALDIYDYRPESMKFFLANNGWHFNRKACAFAVSLMKKTSASGKEEDFKPKSKEEVEGLFSKYGIKLKNSVDYDMVYLLNMYLSDLPMDERTVCHVAKFIREDVDAADGTIMRRWYATMVGNGQPIYWDELIE